MTSPPVSMHVRYFKPVFHYACQQVSQYVTDSLCKSARKQECYQSCQRVSHFVILSMSHSMPVCHKVCQLVSQYMSLCMSASKHSCLSPITSDSIGCKPVCHVACQLVSQYVTRQEIVSQYIIKHVLYQSISKAVI